MRIVCDEPASEVLKEVVEGQVRKNKPQRTRNMHTRLQECVITSDNVVDDEGELVHYAFYADTKSVNANASLK